MTRPIRLVWKRPRLWLTILALALWSGGSMLVVTAGGWTSSAEPPSVRAESDDDAMETRLVAERAIRENCLICHNDDLITSQRLTGKQWKAEVEKMVGWGSPLPVEQQAPVIAYLTDRYPASAAATPLSRSPLAVLAAGLDPLPDTLQGSRERGADLYQRNCANCHGIDGLGNDLGPNLVEKPVLYRRAEYSRVVQLGQGRMPGFAGVMHEADSDSILAWLRAQVYRPQPVTPR